MKNNLVLIQCGDHLENQKRIIPLTVRLGARGYTPVVLVYSEDKGRLFMEHGVDVIAYNSFLRRATIRNNISSTHDWKINSICGVPIFEVMDIEQKRQPTITLPKNIDQTIRKISNHIHAVSEILQHIQPSMVGVWNGYTGFVANILRIICLNRGLTTFFMERGLFRDSLFVDPDGVNGNSSLNKIDAQQLGQSSFTEADEQISHRLLVDWMTTLECAAPLASKLDGKRIIFFPLQVQRDTNILFHSTVWSMRQVVINILNSIAFDKDTLLVVRPHPEEDPKTKLNLPTSKQLIIDSSGDLHSWIKAASVVLTINSTVGLEALIHRKPVIALGKSIYSNKGLTCDSSVDLIGHPLLSTQVPDSTHLKKYLTHLVKNSLILPINHSLFNSNPLNWLDPEDTFANKVSAGKSTPAQHFNKWGIAPAIYKKRIQKKLTQIQELAHSSKTILIHVMFGPEEKIDLTYRLAHETLTRSWIIKTVRQLIDLQPSQTIEINTHAVNAEFSLRVALVRERSRHRKEQAGYHLTIDSHGAIVID